MPLELHVWGPAFGLPSIEAECLAAIAYLSHCLGDGEWVLVASSDTSISPTSTFFLSALRAKDILSSLLGLANTDLSHPDELPALRSGTLWISRYRNIIDYLRKFSAGAWDLERGLSKQQRADSIA
jgi:sorting and assembly machinery component 37